MYSDDPQTSLEELTSLPQCDVGSPSPQIYAHEHGLLLAYLVQSKPPFWGPEAEAYAVVRFVRPQTHLFGSPSDETLNGHPLYAKGLGPYSRYRVLNSSWIKSLEQMNSLHPFHKPESYNQLSHYIFTFHDSTFECIARSLEVQMFHAKAEVASEIASEFNPSW